MIKSIADQVVEELHKLGVATWYDRDIEGGSDWRRCLASKSNRGFTLIELIVVIAIIAIIAAIAIPNLLKARASANEASAISSLRTLVSSNAMFYQGDIENDSSYDYATGMEEICAECEAVWDNEEEHSEDRVAQCNPIKSLCEALASPESPGQKSGYIFEYVSTDPFQIDVVPAIAGLVHLKRIDLAERRELAG